MLHLKNATVAIVGLGLMGGSLAAALRARGAVRRVRGIVRRPESLDEALARALIDDGTCDLIAGVREADIVILATPVRTSIDLLGQLAPHCKPGCIVTDMGSTKAAIVTAMSGLPTHVHPIGGHPMCGKEVAGLSAAEPGLFQGKVYVLTPLERTPPEVIHCMQEMVQIIGSRYVVLNPLRHDRLVAAVSHLPYLLAICLVNVTEEMSTEDALVWELAASGFRDTSRLAASETSMMRDILMTNQENVRHMINSFQSQLAQFVGYLGDDDEANLTRFMSAARQRREGMYQ